MSLCPEFEERASLDDGAFWESVLQRQHPAPPDEPDLDDERPTFQSDPCAECGERGACAYDAEGRALIHATAPEEES